MRWECDWTSINRPAESETLEACPMDLSWRVVGPGAHGRILLRMMFHGKQIVDGCEVEIKTEFTAESS